MKIEEILKTTQHRSWQMPTKKWNFYQEWNNALFLHYEITIDQLKPFVPKKLEIDTFKGKAWVSIVAFTMEKIRLRNLPHFAPISNFHEVNIRTYVKANGKTGVYFLSIEASKQLSCIIAKKVSKLPYRFSNINRNKQQYQSKNLQFGDYFNLEYEIDGKINQKSTLDKWLTERYALFEDNGNDMYEFEIHHAEWEVYNAKIRDLEINYPRFKTLLKNTPDKIQYSPGVQVIAWNKVII